MTKQNDIDLLTAQAPATFGGTVRNTIGTNGGVNYGAGFTGPGTATPGRLLVTRPVGATVQISCETSNNMRNNGGCCGNATRTADQFRFVVGTSNAAGPGMGNQCQGLGTNPVNHVITGNAAQDTILLGMRMNVTNVRLGGQYVTTVGSSSPLRVRVRKITGGTVSINTDVNLFAAFQSAIAFASVQNMLFGTIDYPVIGPSDRANLATDNSMTYAGNFTGAATGTAGFAAMTGVENNAVLEVFCDTTATLTRSGGGSIQVTNIEVDPQNGRGAIGTGSPCNGLAGAPAMAFTYNNSSNSTIYFGGRLNGSTATSFGSGGNFSTANGGGDRLDIVVLNQ